MHKGKIFATLVKGNKRHKGEIMCLLSIERIEIRGHNRDIGTEKEYSREITVTFVCR